MSATTLYSGVGGGFGGGAGKVTQGTGVAAVGYSGGGGGGATINNGGATTGGAGAGGIVYIYEYN